MPKKINFTKRVIEALEPPADGRAYHYDAGQANLALCVTAATGAKTFYRIGRVSGRPVRMKLGAFPDLSVENARTQARAANGDIAKGEDPHQKRLAKRHEQTLKGLFDFWMVTYAKETKKTWASDQWQFDKYLASWHSRKLSDIHQADVEALHARLGLKHGHYTANRVLAMLRTVYSKASKVGYTGPNPCLGVERFAERSRERFLLPDEMRPFFVALKAEPPAWRNFWLLCLFTGARRGNVASMRWAELDLDAGLWHLPGTKTKNKRPTVVVLPPPAAAILETRHEALDGAEFVFPSGSNGGHIIDPRKSWARVLAAAELDNLRPHDLRRSLGSWQAIAGASLPIIGASLGHTDPKATAVYARLIMGPVKESVDSTVALMIAAGEPKPKAKPKVKATRKPAKKATRRKGARNGKAK